MTTPQDIQAALDALDLLQKRAYSHAEKSNGPKEMRDWIDSDAEKIRAAIQSHAPDASPIDAEALKKGNHNVNNPLYRDYNIGWNACIDYLLRRGFRQGGGS